MVRDWLNIRRMRCHDIRGTFDRQHLKLAQPRRIESRNERAFSRYLLLILGKHRDEMERETPLVEFLSYSVEHQSQPSLS